MSDTRAIRPEIKGLFDTIRQQAVQYAESFEKLQKNQADYELLFEKTNKIQKELSNSVKSEILALRGNFNELSELLKIEQSKINQTYAELRDLKYLQKSYSEKLSSISEINDLLKKQSDKLTQYFEEYQKFITNLNETTNGIISNYTSKANEQIDNIVKQNLVEFDKKVSLKIRELEKKIEVYDKSISIGQTNSDYNIKVLLSEVNDLKETIKRLGGRNLMNLDKVSLIDGMNIRLDEFDGKVNRVNQELVELKSSKQQYSIPADDNSNSNNLTKVNALKKEISELENKHNFTIGVGIIALLISIVSMTLIFML